jgi:hypothetical protein
VQSYSVSSGKQQFKVQSSKQEKVHSFEVCQDVREKLSTARLLFL